MEDCVIRETNCPTEKISSLKKELKLFKWQFRQKWTAASYKEERFLQNNAKWLTGTIKLSAWVKQKTGRPRPSKEFGELSDRSKRRKTKELRAQVPDATLTYAAQMSLRAAGKSDASAIIKEITKSPTRAYKIRKVITQNKEKNIQRLSTMEALSMFVEAGLSRSQYNVIRSARKQLYPCYSLLQKAKADCYPKPESFHVTDTCAEIKLQDLVDHTASRLYTYLEEVLKGLSSEEKENLKLISKWGCDGSQQTRYMQSLQNTNESYDDANIFQSSFLPLRLLVSHNSQSKVIWQNPVPSSPRFCRPIRIRFVHETNDITRNEISYIESQIEKLNLSEIILNSEVIKVKHLFLFTMVDGKVCNAATNTLSTMRCYICKATSKDFNKLETRREEDPATLKFGLSILHARIRLFESILHLAYKLPTQKWQSRSSADKKIVNENKIRIQQQFKEEMSLLVDVPKAGFGNTNTGNVSRRFFCDPETASRITGVDLDLIKRLRTLLEVISSGHRIDTDKLSTFCKETSEIYVRLYGWYPMTPTLHKLLVHGPTIIKHAIIPIGQLSEEAAEARNKHFRQYRTDFARKFSKISCNVDVLNRLLLSSDPLLSCTRSRFMKNKKPFTKEALEFLIPESDDSEDTGAQYTTTIDECDISDDNEFD